MKTRLFSDLHLEQGKFKVPVLEDDANTILVLAGDIDNGLRARFFIEQMCERFYHVIYVLGNHEYWVADAGDLVTRWNRVAQADMPDNFHFLHNSMTEIDGVAFLGTPLWTDFKREDWFEMNYTKNWYDFTEVKFDGVVNTAKMHIKRHEQAMEFLECLPHLIHTKKVVITHFLPTWSVIDPKFKNSMGNGFYAANADHLIPDADLWLFGHTHESIDTMLGDTRVVCNPRGYVNYELNRNFDPVKVIEL